LADAPLKIEGIKSLSKIKHGAVVGVEEVLNMILIMYCTVSPWTGCVDVSSVEHDADLMVVVREDTVVCSGPTVQTTKYLLTKETFFYIYYTNIITVMGSTECHTSCIV